MDNQIFEENEIKKNDNLLSYKEQYEEIKGNSIRKRSNVKKIQKNFLKKKNIWKNILKKMVEMFI